MTDKKIIGINMGGDWIKLIYSRKSDKSLQFFLDQFNINDYHIYKRSKHFRQVSIEDLYVFKYSTYILFNKDLYNTQEINSWIDKVTPWNGVTFLDKPFPPQYVKEKIRIIQ